MLWRGVFLYLPTIILGVCLLQAQTPQTPPIASGSPCSVQRSDNDSVPWSEFAFSGRVRDGETYRCAFTAGLTFELLPVTDGWQITIREDKNDENLARLTPTLNGLNPLSIIGSDFRKDGTRAGANNGDLVLPEERKFVFSVDVSILDKTSNKKPLPEEKLKSIVGSNSGSVRIKDIQVTDESANNKAGFSEMSFDVAIHLSAVHGIPLYKVGGGVSAPKVTYAPDPEYSEEARRDRYQANVILWIIVGTDGLPRNIKEARVGGRGLDEKAIEAVRKWRFKPAMKDGQPVPVQINVSVSFRL